MKYIIGNSQDFFHALITTIRQDITNNSYEKRSFKEVYAAYNKTAKKDVSTNELIAEFM